MSDVHMPAAYPRAKLIDQSTSFTYWRDGHLFIKTPRLSSRGTYDQAVTRTLANEAGALNYLTGIATVPYLIDYREDDGTPILIATSFIEGRHLGHDTLRLGPISADRVARIYTAVALGLNQVHDAGLIHGDVKPSNLMLSSDGVRIIDFGLARVIDANGYADGWLTDLLNHTETDGPMGTANFMAPEVCQEGFRSIMSDVYSFGCTLYWTLTGEGPFAGTTPVEIAYGHVTKPPPAPSTKVDNLDPRFDDIVARCLAKDSAERYARMSDLCADLLELIDDAA